MRNEQELLAQIKKIRPTDIGHLGGLAQFQRLGGGVYRESYEILNLDMVIKFPKYANDKNMIEHSVFEMRAMKKVLASKVRYLALQRYVPKVFYFDKRTGVIVMEKLQKVQWTETDFVTNLLKDIMPHKSSDDVGVGNMGKTAVGQIKISDWGLIGEEMVSFAQREQKRRKSLVNDNNEHRISEGQPTAGAKQGQ